MEKIKINFGCFNRLIKGWTNVDFTLKYILAGKVTWLFKIFLKLGLISKYNFDTIKKFKGVVYGDIRKKLRWKNNSVEYINHSQVLEHLYYDKAVKFLRECFRILKKGGIMRISVPDFEKIVKEYTEGLKKRNNQGLQIEKIMDALYARNLKSQKYGHKWMYDRFSLKNILEKCGFMNIKILKNNILNGEILDEHSNSIFIEAIK